MDQKEFEEFLRKFPINQREIYEVLGDQKILDVNGNIFLTHQEFNENEVYHDYMIFIKIKDKLVPTKFLLNWIKEKSKIVLKPKTEKIAFDFTYSKDIYLDQITNKEHFANNLYYILTYDGSILGYVQKKGRTLVNKMNIGVYLGE